MAYVPLVSPLAPPCAEMKVTESKDFSSKASLETATPGMVVPAVLPNTKPPAGLKFLKSKNGRNPNPLDQEEPVGGPQEFLRKYWYILLPLFIMSMTSGGAPEEGKAPHPSQASGQQGGGGAQVSPPARVAASAPSSGGAGAQRRRGKRG